MSHVVTVKTEIRDPVALDAACRRLGLTGGSCQEASRLLEQALGQTQSDVRTAEYYQPAAATTEQQQRS